LLVRNKDRAATKANTVSGPSGMQRLTEARVRRDLTAVIRSVSEASAIRTGSASMREISGLISSGR